MHELGIIVHIAKTLDQVAAENELKKIGSVTLDIGEVSGIVPEYLTECWEFYRKKNPLIAECEMKIESLPAVTICEDCQKTYETVTYGRQCPHCGSYETYLVTGNECSIKELEACYPEAESPITILKWTWRERHGLFFHPCPFCVCGKVTAKWLRVCIK